MKLMKPIKNLFIEIVHILSPEILLFTITTVWMIMSLINSIYPSIILVIAFAISFILYVMSVIKTYRLDESRYYLRCIYSVILPNHIWVVQRSKVKPYNDGCPKAEFTREALQICKKLKSQKKGTTVNIVTHKLLKEHIEKKFDDVKITKTSKKSVGDKRHGIMNTYCTGQCKSSVCNIRDAKEKSDFYSIRIRI